MAKHAHEMETKLQEGTWYIRGCRELRDYFNKIECDVFAVVPGCGYFITDGNWDYKAFVLLNHRTEITLQDYLESLGTTYVDNTQVEKEQFNDDGSLYIGEGLENYYIDQLTRTKKYFVFPKAPEGDFPDLSGFEGVEMDTIHWKTDKIICKIKRNNKRINYISYYDGYNKVRPIQKQKLTLAELAEKAGLDINNIEIIE